MSEKIQKVLARLGIASRREIERWIAEGRIDVNGKVATIGDRISENDKIWVDGRRIKRSAPDETRILIYNKPEGQVVTRSDPDGRETVFEALPPLKNSRWINIGRLDINTSGLLLFTNDGDIAHQLMHPSSHIDREYAVRVFGEMTPEKVKKLAHGVRLEDGLARFEDIKASETKGANRWFHVVIAQGKNRIVRRLFESQDCKVSRLIRVRFGPVVLPDNLYGGRYTECSATLKDALLSAANPPE